MAIDHRWCLGQPWQSPFFLEMSGELWELCLNSAAGLRVYLFRQIGWSMQWTKVQRVRVELTTLCYNIRVSDSWHFFVDVDHLCIMIICHTSVFGEVLLSVCSTPSNFPSKNESKNFNMFRIVFSTFFSRKQRPCKSAARRVLDQSDRVRDSDPVREVHITPDDGVSTQPTVLQWALP